MAHENGSRGFTVERAEVYAGAFKANAAWLLTGDGPPSDANAVVPIAGYVGAGGAVFMADSFSDSRPAEQVELPPGSFCAYAAFKARGDSIYPAYRDGELLLARKSARPLGDCVNRDRVELDDSRTLLRMLMSGSVDGHFTLLWHNGAPLHDVKIKWAWPVECTRKP